MPGIFGIVSNENEPPPLIQAELERMARPLRRGEWLRADLLAGPRAGLGALGIDQGAPLVASRGDTWLAFYGALVQEDELRRQLNPDSSPSPEGLAGLLLDLYLQRGLEPLYQLNGGYGLALWDAEPGRLVLMNDRLSYRPLYYWAGPDRLMFASEYKSITWHPRFEKTIDPLSVADLFHFRTPVGGRTLFASVRALPPAGRLVYQDGRVQIDTYWQPRYFPVGQPVRSEASYAGELADHLCEAIRRRVHPDTCLLVTGGLDSRTVAGFFRRVAPAVPLAASTVCGSTGQDGSIGRQVAEALGLSYTRIPLTDDYLSRYAARAAWQGEGRLEAYASWILAQADFMRAQGLDYALTGLYGNLVSGRNIPRKLLKARTLDQALTIVGSLVNREHQGLARVMRPELFRTAGMESAGFYADVYSRADAPDLLYRYDHISLAHRVSRHGNTADALGDVSLFLEPFLDNDVIEFTFSGMPSRVRAQARFYYEMITRTIPEVARIEEAKTGRTVNTGLLFERFGLLKQLEDYRRRGMKRLVPGRDGEANSCVPLAGAIRGGSRGLVESVLGQAEYLDDYFDMPSVRALLDDHLAGKTNAFQTISSLLTFSFWRRQFVELDGPLAVES